MTRPDTPEQIAAKLTAKWAASPYETHKRPPFRAHSFDSDDRFWVVGSTSVSVMHAAHGSQEWAEAWAGLLNNAHAILIEQKQGK